MISKMKLFLTFLKEIENKNINLFDLCQDFERLSLKDQTGTSSSSSSSSNSLVPSSYSGYMLRFFTIFKPSERCNLIMNKLKAPFINLPSHYINSISKAYNIDIFFGFRFNPGQSELLVKELRLPESFENLTCLKNALGLSYYKMPQGSEASMLGLITNRLNKVVVEVMTFHNNRYSRFLVLVCLGVGCTIWFASTPGFHFSPPEAPGFEAFESYEPFFNMDHVESGFRRVGIVERNDVPASVVMAMGTEQPFAEITIPATGPMHKAISIAIMFSFFLAVGLAPELAILN